MEENIKVSPEDDLREDFCRSLDDLFKLPSKDWKLYSPLELAYIGDAAYELAVRTIFVKNEDIQPKKLHHKVTFLVSAKTQARIISALLDDLDPEEAAIYKRGRNSKPYTKPKNTELSEYLEATGFEAVMGYLYLSGKFRRMGELILEGFEKMKFSEAADYRKSKENTGTGIGENNER